MDYLKEAQLSEENPEDKTNKIFWFIFFGIIFFVIFLVVYFIFAGDHKKISDNKLMEGVAVEVGESDTIKFDFEEEEHGMKIRFTGDGSVEVTISSEPIILNLNINEVKEVDLNNDGIFDIKIKLVSITDGKANIAIQKIYSEVCKEEWECSSWDICDNRIQKRECQDLNSCSTIFDKPSENRECQEITSDTLNKSINDSLNNSPSLNLTVNKSNNLSLTNNFTNNTINFSQNISLYNNTSNVSNTIINSSNSNNLTNITNNMNTTLTDNPNLTGTDVFNSEEEFCASKGDLYFTGNETHVCNIQIYFIFNGTKIPCCESIKSKLNNNTGLLSNSI